MCHENGKIPLSELCPEDKKNGYFTAYGKCQSPECEWDYMRQEIIDSEKTDFPHKLLQSGIKKVQPWLYAGRELEIKVYFHKKTGQILRARPIPHADLDPKTLHRAVEIIAKNRGKEWDDKLKETGDPYIVMRHFARFN